jgi:glycosyltransferase involved in cell wall biosynthesis
MFNPEDPEGIAAAIERILGDDTLRADLRDRGMRRAAELSWHQTARQTLEIYHRAANR